MCGFESSGFWSAWLTHTRRHAHAQKHPSWLPQGECLPSNAAAVAPWLSRRTELGGRGDTITAFGTPVAAHFLLSYCACHLLPRTSCTAAPHTSHLFPYKASLLNTSSLDCAPPLTTNSAHGPDANIPTRYEWAPLCCTLLLPCSACHVLPRTPCTPPAAYIPARFVCCSFASHFSSTGVRATSYEALCAWPRRAHPTSFRVRARCYTLLLPWSACLLLPRTPCTAPGAHISTRSVYCCVAPYFSLPEVHATSYHPLRARPRRAHPGSFRA